MFRKVLVGTDLSPASEVVVSCLPALREVGLKEVVLAHVVRVANTPGLEHMLMEAARPAFDGEATDLARSGFEVTTEMQMGVPAVVLAELAERHDVDALLVGSHGRSLVSRVLLGSVSSGLLHQTTRPVLLLRLKIVEELGKAECEVMCHELFDRLLFPTDFSPPAEEAFARLCDLVEDTKSAVTLLHAQDPVALRHMADRLEEFNRTDQERLDQMRERLLRCGAREVDLSLITGRPVQVLTDEARRRGTTLVVMATQGKGAFAEVIVGSVALNVARLSPAPVLFFPTPSLWPVA